MKAYISSANVKIFTRKDVVAICDGQCLKNESFAFQIYLEEAEDGACEIEVNSDLKIGVYEVVKKKGNYDKTKKTDDFYLHPSDDLYPEFLCPIERLKTKKGESYTLFFDVSEGEKSPGAHTISIKIGNESVRFVLHVADASLCESDLITTHWFHSDAICSYYGVAPFSEEYYAHFKRFLAAYVRMGNTMLFVPVFTPPLDTEVGKERLTTQLVKVQKSGETYSFDFSEMKRYVDIAKSYGIKYFELSHLFTQWGGAACPKIEATEKGETVRLFGWDAADDESYLRFLKAYFVRLDAFLTQEHIKDVTYMHLTDEPSADHIERYASLSEFVKSHNFGVKTMDALSHFDLSERAKIDLPAVSMQSKDLPLFNETKKLFYYCVDVDENYLTNRYFHMPFLRTVILGVLLYEGKADGFLHWGYNFYNTQLSKSALDPNEDATAGGGFPAGDAFIVYPSSDGVNYSIRYFAILKAMEDYRLLKTVEQKIGRENTEKTLREYGVNGLHEYPRSVEKYEALRAACYACLSE